MELVRLICDIADEVVGIDGSGVAFKQFAPGVGPYGEPQLVREIARRLGEREEYRGAKAKRTPDMLIPGRWALEFKIARPFGDNGKEAENWSVNLLHPYEGNVSVIGDCFKLRCHEGGERRAVVVIGYEHIPAQIELAPLFDCFEAICGSVMGIELGPRVVERRGPLRHPVHQQTVVVGWEVVR
jgi:hypothetical protein